MTHSFEYMNDEVERIKENPADEAAFRAFDLNANLDPYRDVLVTVDQWKACERDELPARSGQCFVGIDLGGSAAMCAAVAIWGNGRVEAWAAYPKAPDLRKRGRNDGVGNLYERMQLTNELLIFGEYEVTDAVGFLKYVAERLKGQNVVGIGADRYRAAELSSALQEANLNWYIKWRGTGAHAKADGSHDVRAFQNAVLNKELYVKKSLLFTHALSGAMLRKDETGNPAIYKGSTNSRIDVVQAGVIACGLRSLRKVPKKPAWRVV